MGETISHMIEQVQAALSQQFARLKSDIQSGRRQDDTRLDALAALNFAITNVVVGPGSRDRRILLRLAMHVFLRTDIGKKEELAFISDNMSTLEVVCNISEFINSACDGSTLFWIRSMVPAYFSSVFRRPQHAHQMQYVLASLSDALKTLKVLFLLFPPFRVFFNFFLFLFRALCIRMEKFCVLALLMRLSKW